MVVSQRWERGKKEETERSAAQHSTPVARRVAVRTDESREPRSRPLFVCAVRRALCVVLCVVIVCEYVSLLHLTDMLTRGVWWWLQEAMGLSPSLLALFLLVSASSASVLVSASSGLPVPVGPSCEQARQKCAYRTGCGRALQRYGFACLGLEGQHCPDACRDALVILTSTPEGQELMTCSCTDEACEDSKRRVEACRPAVAAAARNESVYSCDLAQWVCAADPTCGTALDYYNRLCRRMFAGQKCTKKCKNSINILRRQKKAAKLDTCLCDGREDTDFDCGSIRENMAHLCFPTKKPLFTNQKSHRVGPSLPDVDTNEIMARGESRAAVSTTRASRCSLVLTTALIANLYR